MQADARVDDHLPPSPIISFRVPKQYLKRVVRKTLLFNLKQTSFAHPYFETFPYWNKVHWLGRETRKITFIILKKTTSWPPYQGLQPLHEVLQYASPSGTWRCSPERRWKIAFHRTFVGALGGKHCPKRLLIFKLNLGYQVVLIRSEAIVTW